ncbi:hypothetical protein B0H14DRAFT_2830743, partial [Mycena olivaceomarginata]
MYGSFNLSLPSAWLSFRFPFLWSSLSLPVVETQWQGIFFHLSNDALCGDQFLIRFIFYFRHIFGKFDEPTLNHPYTAMYSSISDLAQSNRRRSISSHLSVCRLTLIPFVGQGSPDDAIGCKRIPVAAFQLSTCLASFSLSRCERSCIPFMHASGHWQLRFF